MNARTSGSTVRVEIKGRFARSVTLDRDSAEEALDGYLPTGRSLDVLRRIARGLTRDDASRAFSITGPYGSGKSSLAVLLDAALGPADATGYAKARAILRDHAPDVLAALVEGRQAVGAADGGFLRAVITAPQREPVITTVLRALARGAGRAGLNDFAAAYKSMLKRATTAKYSTPGFSELEGILRHTCARLPVLLVIDEFGKNLEAYADAGGDGDLYLLQELAELTQGSDRLPMVVATIQHLAFEAYAADVTASQRREWAKVQGRLEDVPFLDSPAATRQLIAAALVHDPDPTVTWLRHEAAHYAAASAADRGVAEVADADLAASCWPLHPSVLLVLPDLCARYGQNERTLFSFLASDAPSSAKSIVAAAPKHAPLPWVRLDAVYDYFVESASTFVGASRDASRWIEIETTIRDAHGLTDPQRRLLKTVGVFNLVAAMGTVRASTDLLAFALTGAGDGLENADAVADRLAELARLGIVVHRDFAGEYRIWQGSDFDLDGALAAARRRAADTRPAALLNEVAPLAPIVAGRHAVQHGTIRAFERCWTDEESAVGSMPAPESAADGLLLYTLDPEGAYGAVADNTHRVPLVIVTADPLPVIRAAVEVAALSDVAADTELRSDDHAVRRELRERLGHAKQVLSFAITRTYGHSARWAWTNPTPAWRAPSGKIVGTSYLSAVLDAAYDKPWPADYEAINRAELSSAGARARRVVLNALADPRTCTSLGLGLTGHGAEVAIYRAVLANSGLHGPEGITGAPRGTHRHAWDTLMAEFDDATAAPVSATHLLDALMAPPHGLRAGVAGIVLTAGLLHRAADIAVYEHGTFKPRLDGALVERLVRNPRNFAVKYLAASAPQSIRSRLVARLAESLGTDAGVLPVTTALVRLVANKGKYARTTRRFGQPDDAPVLEQRRTERALAVRDAILDANQPDELLFADLPVALGHDPAEPPHTRGGMSHDHLEAYVDAVTDAAAIIRDATARLIDRIADTVLESATHGDTVTRLASLAEAVAEIDAITSEIRTFAGQAMLAGMADTRVAWVTSLATACTGTPPENWTDADIGPNLITIARIATDFRRVGYLAQGTKAIDTGEPFTAYALSTTGIDGRSSDIVVAVPHRQAAAGDEALDEAIDALADSLGIGRGRATELLTGTLAKRLCGPEAATESHRSGIVGWAPEGDTKGAASA